jgi:DNA polymerase alpha subunit A
MLVLIQVQEEMRNGQVALEKYVITKTLTKPPEAYPDAKNQPHVLVSTNYFLFSST